MIGCHTRWVRSEPQAEDPEQTAIREALAFGKTVYHQRRAFGFSFADLAGRADMTADEIECIEEGRHQAHHRSAAPTYCLGGTPATSCGVV